MSRFGLKMLLLVAGLSALPHAASARTAYRTDGSCDGFPRIDVRTAPGLCLGLVAEGLGYPRGVAVLGNDVYVADMGGWQRGRGRILRLRDHGRGKPEVVLRGLDEPNALVAHGAELWVGVIGGIRALTPAAADPAASQRDVVTGLPGDGRHPLTSFVVAGDGSLFINVGSRSDHCEDAQGKAPDPARPCAETQATPPYGSVLHLVPGKAPVDARDATVIARGLRNAMALAVLGSGELLAAANARDSIDRADAKLDDAELPHEPFARVVTGADYGWPYCTDGTHASPEFPGHDCSRMRTPDLLLPAHAAPLGMLVVRDPSPAPLAGKVLLGFHGYRANGHRLSAITLPTGNAAFAPPQDVVWGWDFAEGVRPRGTPVALAQLADGSVLITEDHNATLLRLASETR